MADASKTIVSEISDLAKRIFLSLGILPFILIVIIIVFASQEPRFLSPQNIFNVTRQATYLVIIALGQMITLLTAGFDLSIGSNMALASVVAALVMTNVIASNPDAVVLAITLGIASGLAVGFIIGLINGCGVALLNVPPFLMTLGMLSVAFSVVLTLTAGIPIRDLPEAFKLHFGYGTLFGIPSSIYFTIGFVVFLYYILYWTRIGRYFYAIGSNREAARLAGINTKICLVWAYILCGVLAASTGVLLTARTGSGEPTLGGELVFQSLAACAIGGVSLFGGRGRVAFVVMGALFIALLSNGLNLIRMGTYLQQFVLGVVLILAIVVDQIRLRYIGASR